MESDGTWSTESNIMNCILSTADRLCEMPNLNASTDIVTISSSVNFSIEQSIAVTEMETTPGIIPRTTDTIINNVVEVTTDDYVVTSTLLVSDSNPPIPGGSNVTTIPRDNSDVTTQTNMTGTEEQNNITYSQADNIEGTTSRSSTLTHMILTSEPPSDTDDKWEKLKSIHMKRCGKCCHRVFKP